MLPARCSKFLVTRDGRVVTSSTFGSGKSHEDDRLSLSAPTPRRRCRAGLGGWVCVATGIDGEVLPPALRAPAGRSCHRRLSVRRPFPDGGAQPGDPTDAAAGGSEHAGRSGAVGWRKVAALGRGGGFELHRRAPRGRGGFSLARGRDALGRT